MKPFFILVAAFVVLPTFAVIGCNAILDNQPGKLDVDASSSSSQSCGADQKNCGTCVPVNDPKLGCGGACTVCPSPSNAQAGCNLVNGTQTCGLGACNAQFDDCNGDPADGCETHTTVRSHCGSCGNDCLQEFCERQGDGYACSATCDPPNTQCTTGTDVECIDTTTDNSNCGTCGTDCTSIQNAVGTCVSGSCNIVCDTGFIKCGSQCVPPNDSQCEADCKNCGGGYHCSVDPSHQNGQCLVNGSCTTSEDCNTGSGEECCQGTCHAQGHNCGTTCASCASESTCVSSCTCPNVAYPTPCSDNASNTYWCCGATDQCGTQASQCIPQCNDARYDCTQVGGGCGCNTSGTCLPSSLNTDTNCGTCETNCQSTGTCCCPNAAGGGDGGVSYSCSGTKSGGGDAGVSGCNCSG